MTPEEEKTHLTKKIEQVNSDIELLRQSGKADKQVEVLYEYMDYLKDELRMLNNQNNN